jgi:hypothetical protein
MSQILKPRSGQPARQVHRRMQQKGYALVSSMLFAVVSLTITGAVLTRMSMGTQQVSAREQEDTSLSFTESAINHVMDSIARKTFEAPTLTAKAMINEFHGPNKDWLGVAHQSTSKLKITRPTNLPQNYSTQAANSGHAFFNSIETNNTHTLNFWNHFKEGGNSQDIGSAVGISATTLDALHAANYSVYHLQQGRHEADFVVSVIPLSHSISDAADESLHQGGNDGTEIVPHADVFKIRATAYVPNIANARRTRSVDLLIRRPVRNPLIPSKAFDFEHAILADGTVEMQNKTTSSGLAANLIDDVQAGDVHSNQNITFGPNGKVQGKATSAGWITLSSGGNVPDTTYAGDPLDPRFTTTNVTNKEGTRSKVDPIEIPEFLYEDLVVEDRSTTPPTYDIQESANFPECPAHASVYKNCFINGDLSLTGGTNVRFEGNVYINGAIKQKGNGTISAGPNPADPNAPPVRVIVKDDIDLGGTTNSQGNTKEILFMTLAGNVKIAGNPGTNGENGAVFVVNDPTKSATFSGTQDFFGAMISRGKVFGQGSAGGIKRDSDMKSLSQFAKPDFEKLPLSEFYPRVISWKEN